MSERAHHLTLFTNPDPGRSHDDGRDLSWREIGLCAQTDPEAFFPEKGGSAKEAKNLCRRCEVRPECLEHALLEDERFGVWGGTTERERRVLRKNRGLA